FPDIRMSSSRVAGGAFLDGLTPADRHMVCGDDLVYPSIAYVTVDAHADVARIVRAAASDAGYPLEVDQEALTAYRYQNPDGTFRAGAGRGAADIVPGRPFDRAWTYLVGHRNQPWLTVDIIPAGAVTVPRTVLCRDPQTPAYDGTVRPPSGRTMIVFR